MKPITINVSSPVYEQYKQYAQKRGRKVSELIREAMEQYLLARIENKPSIKNRAPLSLVPKAGVDVLNDDLFGEMVDGES